MRSVLFIIAILSLYSIHAQNILGTWVNQEYGRRIRLLGAEGDRCQRECDLVRPGPDSYRDSNRDNYRDK